MIIFPTKKTTKPTHQSINIEANTDIIIRIIQCIGVFYIISKIKTIVNLDNKTLKMGLSREET